MSYFSIIYNFMYFFINIILYSSIYKFLFNSTNKIIYKNNKRILKSKPSLSILYMGLLYFIFLIISPSVLITFLLIFILIGLFALHQLDTSKLYLLKIIDKNPYIIKVWNALYFYIDSFLNLLKPLHNTIIYIKKILLKTLINKLDCENKDNNNQLLMEEFNNLIISIDDTKNKNDIKLVKEEHDELYNLLKEMNNVFVNLEKHKNILDSYN